MTGRQQPTGLGSQGPHSARLPCRWPAKDVVRGDTVWPGLNQSDAPAGVVDKVTRGPAATRLEYSDGRVTEHPLDPEQATSKVWLG
jgi:hypothetical protein